MRNREARLEKTLGARMVRWLRTRTDKERRFIKEYGPYASARVLAHVLGWTSPQVDLARRYWAARPKRNAGRVSFSMAFEAFRGRLPSLSDHPAPRWHPARKSYEWTEPQDDLIMKQYGLVSKEELASQLTRLLARLTGDPQASRSPNGVNLRASQLGLDGRFNHGTKGLLARQAAEESGISIHIILDALAKGELPTIGRGKYRFIPWEAWFPWRDRYLARQKKVQAAIQALPEPCISASEARRRLGVGESHLGRFLKGKLLRAWKIDGRWYIAEAHVSEVRKARANGTFKMDTPESGRLRQHANAQHRALRRQQRREPGHTRKAPPGYATPVDLAFEAGVAPASVYSAIAAKSLLAKRNGQYFHIRRCDADEFIAFVRGETSFVQRREARIRDRIHARGGLTLVETMQVLNVGVTQILRYQKAGRLPSFKEGNRRGFLRSAVEALKAERKRSQPLIGRAATIEKLRPAGHVSVSEASVLIGHPQTLIYDGIHSGEITARVVTIGRAHLYFLPRSELNQVKTCLDSRPSRGLRWRMRLEAELSARGLWSSSKAAAVLEVKRGTVIAYVRRKWLKPKLRRRRYLGFAPADVQRLKRHLRGEKRH